MSIKFKFSGQGYFGICRDRQAQGLPGLTDSNGWTWSTGGGAMFANGIRQSWKSGFGALNYTIIEMEYYGRRKLLQIRSGGISNAQTNLTFPQQPYFVFVLEAEGSRVSLVED